MVFFGLITATQIIVCDTEQTRSYERAGFKKPSGLKAYRVHTGQNRIHHYHDSG